LPADFDGDHSDFAAMAGKAGMTPLELSNLYTPARNILRGFGGEAL
jgi:hypothetical protein